jgi:hypothetical protein
MGHAENNVRDPASRPTNARKNDRQERPPEFRPVSTKNGDDEKEQRTQRSNACECQCTEPHGHKSLRELQLPGYWSAHLCNGAG